MITAKKKTKTAKVKKKKQKAAEAFSFTGTLIVIYETKHARTRRGNLRL